MEKLTLANNKSLDVYRTIPLKKGLEKDLSVLDKVNNSGYDDADEIVYKRGEDHYIAVGRGDLRGVKVGDDVKVGADKLKVLYVNNKKNTHAEAAKDNLKASAVFGVLGSVCGGAVAAMHLGGPVGIAITALIGMAVGTFVVYAQLSSNQFGDPKSIWNEVR